MLRSNKMVPIILACLSALFALSLQIGNANGMFTGYGWLVKWLWVLCIVLLGIVVVISFPKRDKEQTKVAPQTPASIRQDASPTITQNVNPVVNIHLGTGHSPNPEVPAPAAFAPARLNINFIGAASVEAHQGINSEVIYESPQKGLGDFHVAVIRFRNDPIVGQKMQGPSVKAQVVYRDALGHEIADVPSGVWLEEYGDITRFAPGEKKSLVIFLLSKQGTLMILSNEAYTTSQSWMSGGPLFKLRSAALSGEVASVEVNLLAQNTAIKNAVFNATPSQGDGLPKLSLRSIFPN